MYYRSFGQTAAPSIIGYQPTSGNAGSSIVVSGSGFTGATTVTVGGVTASFVINSDTQITLTLPASAISGQIVVTPPIGSATSSAPMTISLAPVVTQTSQN